MEGSFKVVGRAGRPHALLPGGQQLGQRVAQGETEQARPEPEKLSAEVFRAVPDQRAGLRGNPGEWLQ